MLILCTLGGVGPDTGPTTINSNRKYSTMQRNEEFEFTVSEQT